jgi:sulfonate transport system substrate-binding protein
MVMTLRVGVHPNNLHLQIAALAWLDAEDRGFSFVPYAEGRGTGQLIADGTIDIGGTGSTPPLLAQAKGVALAYVAASAPRSTNGAIVVGAGGDIQLVTGLAGKRIALLDGSFHTYFLAAALEAEGLSLRDLTRVELTPAASRAALLDGSVDAWIAMEPALSQIRNDPTYDVLSAIGKLIPNRSVFWASRVALETNAGAVRHLLRDLSALGQDIARDPRLFADLLANAGIGPGSVDTWRDALSRRDWSLHPADDTVLDEQQDEADTLFRHGDLSAAINVRQASFPLQGIADDLIQYRQSPS